MRRSFLALPVLLTLLAADNPLEGDKFLQKADERFEQAANRLQEAYAKGMGEAYETRLKTYRSILAAATKAGDFQRASAVQERIDDLEQQLAELGLPGKKKFKPRPKDIVKWGGHEYALIREPAAWHVARKLCEESGGHLATAEKPGENDFLTSLCQQQNATAWIGVTDEVTEGKWLWVTGQPATPQPNWMLDNGSGGKEHCLTYNPSVSSWVDNGSGDRLAYVCEWDD